MEALRTCNNCGLKAITLDDLDKFTFGKDRVHNRKNECKKCNALSGKRGYIKKIYKITLEEYNIAMTSSNICAICGKEGKLHYDHCHTTGKFRGLLCPLCNKGLGLFKDNPQSLQQAIKYLEDK